MNVTRGDVYKALEASGGLDLAGLRRALGIPDGMKGTRAKLRTVLTSTMKAGYVKKEGGTYMLTGKVKTPGIRGVRTDADVRRALEGGIDTIYEISDATGYSVETVKRSLRRMGAVKSRDGMAWRWTLPEGSE